MTVTEVREFILGCGRDFGSSKIIALTEEDMQSGRTLRVLRREITRAKQDYGFEFKLRHIGDTRFILSSGKKAQPDVRGYEEMIDRLRPL